MADPRAKIFADNPVEFIPRKVECTAINMADLKITTNKVEFIERKQDSVVPDPANNFPYTFPLIF